MSDSISRHGVSAWLQCMGYPKLADIVMNEQRFLSVQPEINPIEYRDCANAMLEMWMDNVVTDGEYNRIMDKLNAHWGIKNGRFDQQTGGN